MCKIAQWCKNMCNCWTSEVSLKKDNGFMGITHALSAVTIFLLLMALFSGPFLVLLGTTSAIIIILSCINVTGGAMVPDADNSASTFKSALGIVGDVISIIFRTTSIIIQTTIKTSRDSSDPNPHRGFYHTIPAAVLIGFLIYLLTSSSFLNVTVPIIGKINSGYLFALLFSWLNLHIALAALAKKTMRKIRSNSKTFGEFIAFAFSLTITFILFSQIPENTNFKWVGISVSIGMIIHTLGDCFTTAGSPILFPFPIKGKLWWTVRFLPIKAGGVVENYVFIPFFLLTSIISIVIIYFQIIN